MTGNNSNPQDGKLLRVLTLDGGGAKGLYTLGVLGNVALSSRRLHEKSSLRQAPRLLNFAAMRRWLALLLMFIVPLQLGYAAASACCEHETGMTAKYFGHHVHQHKGQDGSTKGVGHGDSKSAAKNAMYDDCGLCHSSVPQALMHGFELAEPRNGGTAIWPSDRRFSSTDPGRIERPNWTSSL